MTGVLLLWATGCSTRQSGAASPVSEAWHQSRSPDPADPGVAAGAGSTSSAEPIARVNGQPIARDRLIDLLMAGRGVAVLEELIVLELARREAEARGLEVSKRDVESEHNRALQSLLNTLPSANPAKFDREAARRVLDGILTSRGISRREYDLGMLRNAYLRKLAADDVRISEQQLRDEYQRAYGERVQVRHIQLLGGVELDEVRRRLAAGADFVEVARRCSANAVTAPGGGLLIPFCRDDPSLPALLREAAFGLAVGEVSNPIRIDNWYHIIKVEQKLAPADVPFEQVSEELEARIRDRTVDLEMQRISAELFSRAAVEIADPALEAGFFKQHTDLRRSGG